MLKRVLRGLTPPILWEAAAKLRRPKPTDRVGHWEPGVEQPPEFYDWSFETSEHWRSHYTASRYYPLWTVVADRVRRAKARSVLDIGCGPGQMANLLADKGVPRYLGLDFSPARIEHARSICPTYQFEVADALETELIERWDYDIVLALEFLEHVERDLEALQRIRPGTRVIATVPNFPAKAHVRHFEAAEAVLNRYGPCLSQIDIDAQLANEDGRIYFIIEGITI